MAFQINLGVAQFARGACTELQALYIVRQRKVGSRGGTLSAYDAYGENGEVVQLYVLAVQDELFGAGNHVGQHPLNQPLRIGRVVVGHMLGKPFGIESVLNQRTCIPQSFQWAFFAGHLILFVTNHTLLFF